MNEVGWFIIGFVAGFLPLFILVLRAIQQNRKGGWHGKEAKE